MQRIVPLPVVELKPTVLKSQDIAVAFKILLFENRRDNQSTVSFPKEKSNHGSDASAAPWTLARLARETHLSLGEVHNVLGRLAAVRLMQTEGRVLRRHALEEFLIHGIRYVFPPANGPLTRGLPTANAASPLKGEFLSSGEELFVWPCSSGAARGTALSPLYPAAPEAALEDSEFYELLALTDSLRGDIRARERSVAVALLQARMCRPREANSAEPASVAVVCSVT